MNESDAYRILGIKSDSNIKEITKAFRGISYKTHPDRGGSEEEYKNITEAYSLLSKLYVNNVEINKKDILTEFRIRPYKERKISIHELDFVNYAYAYKQMSYKIVEFELLQPIGASFMMEMNKSYRLIETGRYVTMFSIQRERASLAMFQELMKSGKIDYIL